MRRSSELAPRLYAPISISVERRDSRGRSGLWALRLALEAVCVVCPEYGASDAQYR
jgi:hypothetical protein